MSRWCCVQQPPQNGCSERVSTLFSRFWGQQQGLGRESACRDPCRGVLWEQHFCRPAPAAPREVQPQSLKPARQPEQQRWGHPAQACACPGPAKCVTQYISAVQLAPSLPAHGRPASWHAERSRGLGLCPACLLQGLGVGGICCPSLDSLWVPCLEVGIKHL